MRIRKSGRRKWIAFAAIAVAVVAAAVFMAGLLQPPAERHFLWRITPPEGRPAYILGSIHLADRDLYPLSPAIEQAFAESAILAVELNTDEMSGAAIDSFITERGLSDDPKPLPQRLSEETRAALEKSGFYSWEMSRFQPWLAALVIQVEVLEQHGFVSQYGLDRHFINQAGQREMKVLELESLEEQLGLLADMSAEEADLFLRATIVELEEMPKTIRAFLQSWREGDAAAFSDLFFKEYDTYPELLPLLDKIIFQRNQTMADRISRLPQDDGPLFVVIGGGHLVGEGSVLDLLAAKGYKIEQK
ncbi:TraB/GumN family protein [Deltaproteobacteria bacterium OttesenSCG-928-M10]|nr:TraB/GumN family protein [Deltaproteobacteria bacterium OttesenSCG-928-M10]